MKEMNFEKREIDSARLCYGLANIGYKAYAAVEDIIDNSVEAGSTNIIISVDVYEGKTLTERGSIERITIIDDGRGMDNLTVRKALDIGSNVTYDKNSLSKYGLGLKSAGLSLGDKIQVYSKTAKGSTTDCLTLDMGVIKNKSTYGVLISEVTEIQNELFFDKTKGTVVEISNITNYDTVNSLKNKLLDRLGVIYFEFINRLDPLSIKLLVKGKEYCVQAKDIMFKDSSLDAFDRYEYDCKTPCKLLIDQEIKLPNSPETVAPIKLNLTIFPQSNMSGFSGFSEEERKKIKSYGVTLPNSGFFIYRNNR